MNCNLPQKKRRLKNSRRPRGKKEERPQRGQGKRRERGRGGWKKKAAHGKKGRAFNVKQADKEAVELPGLSAFINSALSSVQYDRSSLFNEMEGLEPVPAEFFPLWPCMETASIVKWCPIRLAAVLYVLCMLGASAARAPWDGPRCILTRLASSPRPRTCLVLMGPPWLWRL